MVKRTNLILFVAFVIVGSGLSTLAHPARAASSFATGWRFASRWVPANDREQDGLAGPVRRVKTETAKITNKGGQVVEGPRVVLETATYDIKGTKIDNAYFLTAGGTITGKETYKYDDKGNITEMVLNNQDGSLLSKEIYSYEFDALGNWTKMTTSVAVIEGGKLSFEPTEVTYRTIAYFLDAATIAKMAVPATPVAVAPTPAAAGAVTPAPVAASLKPNPVASQPVAQKEVAKPPVAAPTQEEVAGHHSAPSVVPPPLTALTNGTTTTTAQQANGAQINASQNDVPVVKEDGEVSTRPVAEAPALPLMRGPLKPISGGVLNGKAVSMPAPLYPDIAKRARATGIVTVEVIIDVTGKVVSAKATKGPIMLHQAAETAAKQARFSPTLLSGQPVKISGMINYNFTLTN